MTAAATRAALIDGLRVEFEREYGRDRKTSYGQWLDLKRLPCGSYRSMVTEYAWRAFLHGCGVQNPNDEQPPSAFVPLPERIECIAIVFRGEVMALPRPWRHGDAVWLQERKWGREAVEDEERCKQGFLTDTGRYVSREEAAEIAIKAGQIVATKFQPNKLFSEDLW